MATDFKRLRSIACFGLVSDEALTALAPFCAIRKVPRGTFLFREGNRSGHCYVLITGLVSIQHGGVGPSTTVKMLGRVLPGTLFGESAFFGDRPRTADAVAAKPSEIVEIDGDVFRTWGQEHPASALEVVLGALSNTLVRLHRADRYSAPPPPPAKRKTQKSRR